MEEMANDVTAGAHVRTPTQSGSKREQMIARVHCYIQENGEVAVSGIVEERAREVGSEYWYPGNFPSASFLDLRTSATLMAVRHKLAGIRGRRLIRLVQEQTGDNSARLVEMPDPTRWDHDAVLCAGQRGIVACIFRVRLAEPATRTMVAEYLDRHTDRDTRRTGIAFRVIDHEDGTGLVGNRFATVMVTARERGHIARAVEEIPIMLRALRPMPT